MGLIGEELERARKEKGWSLRDAEDATNIRIKYLEALENEDYQAIPGRVYVIGFLRTYAKQLGLDDESLVSQFKEIHEIKITEDEPQTPTIDPQRKLSRKTSLFLLLGAVALVAVIGSLLWTGWADKTPENGPPQTIEDSSGLPEKPNEVGTEENNGYKKGENNEINGTSETPAPVETEVVSVKINIKEASCWLDVNIDGKNNFKGTLKTGESRTFTGKSLVKIRFGNAGAAEVIYLGKTIYPIGKSGQVVTKEFSLSE